MFGCQNASTLAGEISGYASVVPELRSILPRDTFTYAVGVDQAESAVPGARVRVPFGEREVIGHVVERVASTEFEARAILEVLDEPPPLLPHLVELGLWVAARYRAPLGEVVKAMLPAGVRAARPRGRRRGPRTASRGALAAAETGAAETPPRLTEAPRVAAAPPLRAIAQRRHHPPP